VQAGGIVGIGAETAGGTIGYFTVGSEANSPQVLFAIRLGKGFRIKARWLIPAASPLLDVLSKVAWSADRVGV
jgi:hypothetical protein